MSTNEFTTPLLSRQQFAVPYAASEFARAEVRMKELMVESPRTAALVLIDRMGIVRVAAAPWIVKDEDDVITEVMVNLNNTEISIASLKQDVLKMHVGLSRRRDLPSFAIKEAMLPTELLKGTDFAGHTDVYIYLLPNVLLIPSGKD